MLRATERGSKAGENVHAVYLLFAATLGRRTGELHRALARATGDPAFDPEPVTAADIVEWLDRIREGRTTFERLGQSWHHSRNRRGRWPNVCWRTDQSS
ncbi:MAG: hypothetical protein U1F59_12280 [Candidatus Competibacteraceae bacterium]